MYTRQLFFGSQILTITKKAPQNHRLAGVWIRMDSRILRIVRFIVYLNQPMIPMIHPSFRPRKQILPPNWNQQPRSSAAK
jgi:hypothetical protein